MSHASEPAIPLVALDKSIGKSRRSLSHMMMSQSQRSRYLKTGAIVSAVLLLLLWLSPSKPTVSNIGSRK